MKTCFYCAEEIQDAAVVCKHCGRETGAPRGGELAAQPPVVTTTWWSTLGKLLAAGTFLGWLTSLLVGASFNAEAMRPTQRALSELTASIEVGINAITYAELVRRLSVELAAAHAAAGESERPFLADASAALASYTDALRVWQWKIKHGATLSSQDDPDVVLLATKYRATVDAGRSISADEIIRKAWAEARRDAGSALRAFDADR